MGNHGGYRPGSGRKSKVKIFDDLSMGDKRAFVMNLITDDDVKEIVSNMIERAKTDSKEAQYLLNQFIGKALQAIDTTSGGEKIESFNDEQIKRIAERIFTRPTEDGLSTGSQLSN